MTTATIERTHTMASDTKLVATPAITIVRVKAPWYAPNFFIASKFRQAVADYERIPGLQRKLYTLGVDRHFGGIYLWNDPTAAEAWFSPKWHERVQERYGIAGDVRLWTVPIILEGTATLNKQFFTERSYATTASATLRLFPAQPDIDKALAILEASILPSEGHVRTYLLRGGDDRVGRLDIWNSSRAADAFLKLAIAEPTPLGTAVSERFVSPVGMD